MTVLQKSLGLWFGGAAIGLVAGLANKKTATGAALGALLGAIVVGGVGDAMIEKYDPNYTGLR